MGRRRGWGAAGLAAPFSPVSSVAATVGGSGTGGLWEDPHAQLEAPGAVVATAADEVAGDTGLTQRDDSLPVSVGADRVYGLAGSELRRIHFEDVVQRRVVEHCTCIGPRKITTQNIWQNLVIIAQVKDRT